MFAAAKVMANAVLGIVAMQDSSVPIKRENSLRTSIWSSSASISQGGR